MTRFLRYCAVLMFATAALHGTPANAALTICNQTSYILYAAAGYQAGAALATRLAQEPASTLPAQPASTLPAQPAAV